MRVAGSRAFASSSDSRCSCSFERIDRPLVDEWRDVTRETDINPHVPGIGKSFGWLALDVLGSELASNEK